MIKTQIFPVSAQDHIVNTYGNNPRVYHLDSGVVITQEGDYYKLYTSKEYTNLLFSYVKN